MDASEIKGSKIPPVVWSGTISQASKTKQILLDDCYKYYNLFMYQFPEVWYQNAEYNYWMYYFYTGLWFNKKDLQNISEVIPGSPADKIGIQKGDKILSINGYKIPSNYNDVGPVKWDTMAYTGTYSGFRYLFYSKEIDGSALEFKIKRNNKRITFKIIPEKRTVLILIKKQDNNNFALNYEIVFN